MTDLIAGIHEGTVLGDRDELGMGRLRVLVPTVTQEVAHWALPCVPFAGNNRGIHWMPRKNERVWVTYWAGDRTRPVWLGGFWLPGDLPSEDVDVTVIRTPKASVSIDEESGTVTIENTGGARITMTPSEITLSAGKVTIEAGGRRIELGAASVSVNSGALEVS